MTQFNTTELDFDKIKDNIKTYFQNSDLEFSDWDFEGSGLNTILNILAYNTHYNAMLAHMSMNESFLDSAQVRSNVVSRAKLLGYTPRSVNSAIASIDFVVAAGAASPTPETFNLPQYTVFKATVDGVAYTFLSDVATANYDAESNTYIFEDLVLTQSTTSAPKTDTYYVDNSYNQRFVITDDNVDIDSLIVKVYSNPNSSEYDVYTRFSDFVGEGGAESTIYFLEENTFGKYEVRFGNDVFGKMPPATGLVELEYIACNGEAPNGAVDFEFVQWPTGNAPSPDKYSTFYIDSVTSAAAGGSDREDITSVKFHAPLNFIAQKRAVTATDYYALITQNVGGIDSLVVWGGEDHDPVTPGYVFICAKPAGSSDNLTDAQKTDIENYLADKGVVGIKHTVVDPEYTDLYFEIEYKYDPALTSKSESTINNDIAIRVQEFNDTNLRSFDGVFRHSNFVTMIDNISKAILNTTARIRAFKTWDIYTESDGYDESPKTDHVIEIDFGFKIDGFVEQASPVIINSPSYQYYDTDWHTVSIVDKPAADSIIGVAANQRPIFLVESGVGQTEVGYIDLAVGKIYIDLIDYNSPSVNYIPSVSTDIEFHIVPASNDVVAKRAKILRINTDKTTYYGEIDTAYANRGNTNYTTFDRE